MKDDAYYMKIALEKATISLSQKVLPVGAVVVLDGKIVYATGKIHEDAFYDY